MKWYIHSITNYFNFSGRARRKEYWLFLLFNILIITSLCIISEAILDTTGSEIFYYVVLLYMLFIIIPHLAVVVRRLHDIDKSGLFWFVRIIPVIGPIWLFVLLVEDSSHGNNRYGMNPKNISNEDAIDLIGKE
ncbi:MAG: DUF805 domain-containing protein [Oceanihabitans sp.]|nr:DUF805 domain-containing protein [Oceanihabitans sp.]